MASGWIRWPRAGFDGPALDSMGPRWIRWARAGPDGPALDSIASADELRRRLFAPWGRPAQDEAPLQIAERHPHSTERRCGRWRRSGTSRATSRDMEHHPFSQRVSREDRARFGIAKGKATSETSLRGFQSVAEKHRSALAILGARLCMAGTLPASKRVSRPGSGEPDDSAGAPGRSCRALELRVTLRRKKRRRRVLCAVLREKTAFGFPTAPLTLSSREPAV
jgi:hypothetical protein